MTRRLLGGALIAVSAATAAGGVAPVAPASASAQSGCAARAATAVRRCFPRRMNGSFSGEGIYFTWQGTVSMTGHREQTTYAYEGRATYQWKIKPLRSWCVSAPDHGTITEPVRLSTQLGPDPRRGYSYSGSNGGGGGIDGIVTTCGPDDTGRAEAMTVDGAFSPGGFSRDLRAFAGSEGKRGDEYRFKWSFRATGRDCRKRK